MKEPLEDSFMEGNFFTKLYDAMPLPVYVWKKTEANFVLVSLNSKAKELTKNKPTEILGKSVSDFCCNVSEMLGWLNQVCEQKTVLKKESCCDLVFCKKESLFLLTFSYVAEGLVLMLFEDVSTQRETQHQLFESEEKFRLAFITSPDSININKLENGLCVDVNQGFTEITGYTKEEVLGKTTLELGIWVSPEARQKFVQTLLEKGSVKDFEAKFRAKNGKIIVGLMSARIIKLNGEPHIIAVTRDITKRVELEEELRKIYEEQKKLLQAVEQSHSTIIITDFYGN
ncbi:PAS domain S-box protein, partial [bacterium]|nr:PAS domain S-box protein [bacterium]